MLQILIGAREVWRRIRANLIRGKKDRWWLEEIHIMLVIPSSLSFRNLQCSPNETSTGLRKLWNTRNRHPVSCSSVLEPLPWVSKTDLWLLDHRAPEQHNLWQRGTFSKDLRIVLDLALKRETTLQSNMSSQTYQDHSLTLRFSWKERLRSTVYPKIQWSPRNSLRLTETIWTTQLSHDLYQNTETSGTAMIQVSPRTSWELQPSILRTLSWWRRNHQN